jgi:hypothetical protein
MRRAAECQLRIAARMAKATKLPPETRERLRQRVATAQAHLAAGRVKDAIIEARLVARSARAPLRQKPASLGRAGAAPKSASRVPDSRLRRLAAAEALAARRRRLAAAEAGLVRLR